MTIIVKLRMNCVPQISSAFCKYTRCQANEATSTKHHKDSGTRVERHRPSPLTNKRSNQDAIFGRYGITAVQECTRESLPKSEEHKSFSLCCNLIFLIVVDEYQGRNRKQVQQVHPNREAHKECDENNPPVCMRLVRLLLPL
jgi:hypothetical protein